jgi:hypothetical protein
VVDLAGHVQGPRLPQLPAGTSKRSSLWPVSGSLEPHGRDVVPKCRSYRGRDAPEPTAPHPLLALLRHTRPEAPAGGGLLRSAKTPSSPCDAAKWECHPFPHEPTVSCSWFPPWPQSGSFESRLIEGSGRGRGRPRLIEIGWRGQGMRRRGKLLSGGLCRASCGYRGRSNEEDGDSMGRRVRARVREGPRRARPLPASDAAVQPGEGCVHGRAEDCRQERNQF